MLKALLYKEQSTKDGGEMIEVEEIKKELEQPTDTYVRLLFADMQKPMEALQKVFSAAIDKLEEDGLDTHYASLEIECNKLTVKLGNYVMYRQVYEQVLDLNEGRR